MEKKRVLFISQEIAPFLSQTDIAQVARKLPQGIQESGKEIRAFMPRFGCINERRHQLHEVIRLSGMNLIINDVDHPLIIKVASVPQAKIQVYFIDNEDFFKRKATVCNDKGDYFEDNDERAMFFGRGVLETVKKLGWKPDIIHCHGWMTALTPLYIKKLYNNDPHFEDTKVVYSIYDEGFNKNWDTNFHNKLKFDGFDESDIELLKDTDFVALNKMAINVSDGVVQGSENIHDDLLSEIQTTGTPFLEYFSEESCVKPVDEFYDQIIEELVEN
ncbi:glycogen/starch synthase [Paracrocinitomix mangrovi]|uniref:glycogen/starch synthase n=1 Tax=Paracrocinitomix mangrovi TaxID=2862509 RepID=UPI001C8D564E|nr:glycogen/starch synthase [Paracrocinitomix mangrovi]UKN00634.1 glycogen/starch synthase [Paracrocinitomix mangrovi]